MASASLVVFTSTAVGGLSSSLGAVLGAAIVEGSVGLPAAELAALPRGARRHHRAHPLPPRPGRPLLRPARLGRRRAPAPPRHRRPATPSPRRWRREPAAAASATSRQLGGGASLFPLGVLVAIQLLDQATQSAFNVLTPNIRDAFHLTNAGILLIVAIAGAAGLACTLPVAVLADRMNRVRIALIGALIGAAFSIGVGLANSVVLVTVMLVGVYMGQAVIFPTHNSLLADYYPVPARPRIYSSHRAGIQHRRHRRRPDRRGPRHPLLVAGTVPRLRRADHHRRPDRYPPARAAAGPARAARALRADAGFRARAARAPG